MFIISKGLKTSYAHFQKLKTKQNKILLSAGFRMKIVSGDDTLKAGIRIE